MGDYTKSSKATSNDLWGHETAEGGKSRALRLREAEEAKGAVKVKYSGQQKGPWMPRAIKKQERQNDGSLSKLQKQFNVEKAPAPAPAPAVKMEASSSTAAKGSTSSSWRVPHDQASTSTTSFKGAADLDELADEDVKPKVEESEAKRPKLEPVASSKPPVDPNRDSVLDGAPRLAQHIRTSSKFIKVAGMAYALLEGKQVTEKNAGAFFEVLMAGMEDPHRLRDVSMRVAVRRLYSSAIAKKHVFPPECELTLRVWQLHVLTQIELFTDDSFQFTKAAKVVREAVEGLPCVYPALEPKHAPKHLPEHERAQWRDAIFDCAEACMLHHKHLWAKTTADMVVKAMVDRRQNFSEVQQRTLQEWNATVKGQFIMRQQAHQQRDIHAKRDQTSYERKEAEWHSSDITTAKGGDIQGGNVDNWLAKQSNN